MWISKYALLGSLSKQLLFRICGFVLNSYFLRWVDPKLWGFIGANHLLLQSISVFPLKEYFRMVGLVELSMANTIVSKDRFHRQNAFALAKFGAIAVAGFACSLAVLFVSRSSVEHLSFLGLSYHTYILTVVMTVLGVFFEALAEPFVICSFLRKDEAYRAVGEAIGAAGKAACSYAMLVMSRFYGSKSTQTNVIVCWSGGQVAYGVLWFTYFWYYFHQTKDLRFGKVSLELTSMYFALSHAPVVSGGSVAASKLLLQEGTSIVLALCFDDETRGIYSFVFNLGSMATRTIFAPVEDQIFGYLMAPRDVSDSQSPVSNSSPLPSCAQSIETDRKMHILCKGLFIEFFAASLLFPVLGPPLASSALWVVYGSRWSLNAAAHLGYYCWVLMLSATFGLVDRYVTSSSGVSWMTKVQYLNVIPAMSIIIPALLHLSKQTLGVRWLEHWSSAQLVNVIILTEGLSYILRMCNCFVFLHWGEHQQVLSGMYPRAAWYMTGVQEGFAKLYRYICEIVQARLIAGALIIAMCIRLSVMNRQLWMADGSVKAVLLDVFIGAVHLLCYAVVASRPISRAVVSITTEG